MSIEEEHSPMNEADPSVPEDTAPPAMEHSAKINEQDDATFEGQELMEDDPQLLESTSNSSNTDNDRIDVQETTTESIIDTPSVVTASARVYDEMSDADSIPDDDDSGTDTENTLRDWSNEKSTRAIAVELKHIETEVRNLLNTRDAKRKRKLAGSRRWQELEEDLLSWRFGNWMDEDTILRLQRLVARRNYLFTRLRFLASTRPTWNS